LYSVAQCPRLIASAINRPKERRSLDGFATAGCCESCLVYV